MSVLTLVIKFTSFDLILVSALFPPKAGSATELDHPMRARKRSSDKIATALVRRTII